MLVKEHKLKLSFNTITNICSPETDVLNAKILLRTRLTVGEIMPCFHFEVHTWNNEMKSLEIIHVYYLVNAIFKQMATNVFRVSNISTV